MIVLVFGIQGSGKSTHAHFIANRLNLPYISTGDILRELEKQPTETGKRVRSLMEQVKLFNLKIDMVFEIVVPEETAIARLKSRGRYDDIEDSINTRFNLFK